MKCASFTPLLCILLLAASCSKDTAPDSLAAGTAALVSGWEGASGWTASDSGGSRTFRFGRAVPELTDALLRRGVVLVWVKGLAVKPVFGVYEPIGPRCMPFSFFPGRRQAKWVQDWSFTSDPGQLGISYTTNEEDVVGSDASPNENIRIRYFVIPPAMMAQRQLTPQDIRQLDYSGLVRLCGTAE